jgi:hypothetical protein
MGAIKEDTRQLGWIVDEGDEESSKTHPYTGETASYGWRCEPQMSWYYNSWHDFDHVIVPPFAHGAAKSVGSFKGEAGTCPDGRVNAWEAVVPNGVYMVTHAGAKGCSFENVLAEGVGDVFKNTPSTGAAAFPHAATPPVACGSAARTKRPA